MHIISYISIMHFPLYAFLQIAAASNLFFFSFLLLYYNLVEAIILPQRALTVSTNPMQFESLRRLL